MVKHTSFEAHYAVISAASHHFLLSLMSKYSPKHPIQTPSVYIFLLL